LYSVAEGVLVGGGHWLHVADIETDNRDKESIMGARTTGAASAKRTSPAKKAKKKLFNPKPASNNRKISLGSRVDRLDEVMVMLATSKVETDAKMAASEAMLTKKIAAVSETVNETSRELRQTTRELSESLEKTTKELSESIGNLNGNVGGINNSLGKVVELVLLPGLMDKMNAQFEYQFDNISPNKIFTESGKMYAEVDLFLENGVAVMAVEVKTRVRRDDVKELLKRVGSLRQHENKAGVVGKVIYAAIAGIYFDDGARELATASGMYIVKLDQGNDRIKIEPPVGAVGNW
jgi:hypothetical protein